MPHQPNSSVSSEGALVELSKSKTIIRALTKKFNNRGTQDAAASAAARQRRQQAALRQAGLLPPLSLSQLEAEEDTCIPICDPCQSDLESVADRIKREWEAKNARKEKELPELNVDVPGPAEPEIDDYIVRLIRTDSSSSATLSPTVIAPPPRPSSPSPLATSVASSLPSLYSDSSRATASSPEPVTPQSTGPALDDRENGILDVVIEEPEPLSSRTSFNLKPPLSQSHSRSRSPAHSLNRPPSLATAVPPFSAASGTISTVADRPPSPVSAVDPPMAADRPLSPVSMVNPPKKAARSPSPIAVVDPPKAAAGSPSLVAAVPPPVASADSKMSDTFSDESWHEIPPVPPPKDDRSKTSVAPRKPQKPAGSAANSDNAPKKGVFNRFTRSNTTAGTSGRNGATTSQPPPIPQRRGLSSSPQKRTVRILRTVVGSFPMPNIQRDENGKEKKKVLRLEPDKEEEKQKPSEEEPSSPGSFVTAPSSESDFGPSRGRVMPLRKGTMPVSPTSETIRQAVDPTIHHAGTILEKVNNIEDPETRRITEHAFM